MAAKMQNLQRIAKDLKDANSNLPGIAIASMNSRMDKFFANISFSAHGHEMVMPLMVHLEKDYPMSPPNVGFPVHFPYRMGATDFPRQGEMQGCQVLCLNITGNFKQIHTEWASSEGEGWSPSMTLSGLLVQLQSVLMDLESGASKTDIATLKTKLQRYSIKVDDENEHTGCQPYPPVSDSKAADPKVEMAKPSGPSCYITGASETEDILGYGFKLDGKGNATTPAELLSWEAFDKQRVRTSAAKESFTHWWPRLPAAEARKTMSKQKFDEILFTCAQAAGNALQMKQWEAAQVITSKLINGIIVEMMKGSKVDAVRFFEALVDLRSMLNYIYTNNQQLREAHDSKIRAFINSESNRHKDHVPNLGDLLALYIVRPSQPSEMFLDAYLDENFQRCVMWWQKSLGTSTPAPSSVFEATKVSRDICLFQVSVLALVVGEEEVNIVPKLESFQENWREVQAQVNAGGWQAFFERTRCSADYQKRLLGNLGGWIDHSVKSASARGPKYAFLDRGAGGGRGGRGGGRGRGGNGYGGNRW